MDTTALAKHTKMNNHNYNFNNKEILIKAELKKIMKFFNSFIPHQKH